jgi:hypothetical protein
MLEVIRKLDMMIAAVSSRRFAPRIRPAGSPGVSPGAPVICGITATPVSNPESPSASFGNTMSAIPTMTSGFPCCVVSALHQSVITTGFSTTCPNDTAITTRFRRRNTATRTTAMPIASLNPLRNTSPSSATSPRVSGTSAPSNQAGANGFSTACAVASAAERVMVIMKSVAANPSSTSTKSLPPHQGSSRSSIAIEPSPRKLSRATRR